MICSYYYKIRAARAKTLELNKAKAAPRLSRAISLYLRVLTLEAASVKHLQTRNKLSAASEKLARLLPDSEIKTKYVKFESLN